MATGKQFELNASHPTLDFVNTLEDGIDLLPDYESLLRFSAAVGLSPESAIRGLTKLDSKAKDSAVKEAHRLRENLRRIFSAVAHNSAVANGDLAELNGYLEQVLRHRQLNRTGKAYEWAWKNPELSAASPLWPITLSAADLLASERLALVRECDSDTCGWLFLDTSKNHSRRWCDMKTCGNRFKARSYYQRLREAGEAK
jgi:predicted RNA-binding Zn ribbon-like protein